MNNTVQPDAGALPVDTEVVPPLASAWRIIGKICIAGVGIVLGLIFGVVVGVTTGLLPFSC